MLKYILWKWFFVQKTENYIDQIIKKIDSINDNELKSNIYRLIYERNKLLESVNMDVLTGAYNRRIIDSIDNYSVIALCDIDDFKYINDTYGHDIGDRVLKVVSKILIDNSNKEDIVCRYGGDEFVVFFKKCSLNLVQEKMTIVSKMINDYFKNSKINISFSVGISSNENGKNLNDTIKEADIALYQTKAKGKSGITVYNNSNYKRIY